VSDPRKRILLPAVLLAVVALIIVLVWPSTERGGTRPLVCYVGGTMTPVMQALSAAYRKKTGQGVDIVSAGSGELMATIEMQREGDLYVAHDPFMDLAMQRGLGVHAWYLAEIFPVIVVHKGNPKKIRGLADFKRPDVRLYLTDYRHSTLGNILPVIFNRAGIDFEELKKAKKIPTHRSGSHVANLLIMKAADAAMVWQAVAHLRAEDLDVVRIDEFLPRPDVDTVTSATGRLYRVAPVKVTMVSLTCSQRQREAEGFVNFASSAEGQVIWRAHGFKVPEVCGRKEYVNGIRVAHGKGGEK
jgi:ABC-type molybdate transport system substrate-binding protein